MFNFIRSRQKNKLRQQARSRFFNPKRTNGIRIVAEGDSWYDYPLVRDIVDHLCQRDYDIIKESDAGDTLENIVYGNGYTIDRQRGTARRTGEANVQQTYRAIKRYAPRFVFFSAGGNDIFREELRPYLNHIGSNPRHLLRKEVFNATLRGPIEKALRHFIETTISIDPEVDILMDGYAYPFPTGKRFKLIGVEISGPWLLPNFAAKGITDREDQVEIIRLLVDNFNNLLEELDREYPQFHYIDLRQEFTRESDWRDEIHLTSKAYARAANRYEQKMQAILSQPRTTRLAG